jgi:hypothetical protein
MDQDLLDKELGAETDLQLKLVDGVLKVGVVYMGKGVGATVSVDVSSDYFLDKLAALIPGKLDDSIIGILKMALKA